MLMLKPACADLIRNVRNELSRIGTVNAKAAKQVEEQKAAAALAAVCDT